MYAHLGDMTDVELQDRLRASRAGWPETCSIKRCRRHRLCLGRGIPCLGPYRWRSVALDHGEGQAETCSDEELARRLLPPVFFN